MKGIQIFNFVWLVIWVMGIIGSIWGMCAGNWAHIIMPGGCSYFAILLWIDEEDGESLKDYFKRKLTRNTHKTA